MLASGLTTQGLDTTYAAIHADKDNSLKTRGVVNKILFTYGPENYFVSFFGSPTDTTWGWRFEGHHISLNFTVLADGTVTTNPSFIGTNPNSVKMEDGRNIQVHKPMIEAASKLALSLNRAQLKSAQKANIKIPKFMYYAPGLMGGPLKLPKADPGLSFTVLNVEQRELLLQIIESYQTNFQSDLNNSTLRKIEDAGVGNLEFIWSGGVTMKKPFYFRVQGPTFVLEFSCSEGQADHYHAAWVELK